MKTGITVVTYGRPKLLDFVLGRIFKYSKDVEVVVVSNSDDHDVCSREKALQQTYPFTYIQNENPKVLRARNLGTLHNIESCDFFVEMDDDIIVTPEWLERITTVMRLDENVGIAVPLMNFSTAIWYKDQVIEPPPDMVANILAIVAGNYDSSSIDKYWTDVFARKKTDYKETLVPEITIQVKSKKAVEQGCLWSEELDGTCIEPNAELARRIRECGLKVVSVKNTFVCHLGTATHSSWLAKHPEILEAFKKVSHEFFEKQYGGIEAMYDFDAKNIRQGHTAKDNYMVAGDYAITGEYSLYQRHSMKNLDCAT